MNRHRAIALGTFETFVAGTSDDVTKNAILMEATRSIFAPVQTGYVAGDDDNSIGRVVEVVELASSAGSAKANP